MIDEDWQIMWQTFHIRHIIVLLTNKEKSVDTPLENGFLLKSLTANVNMWFCVHQRQVRPINLYSSNKGFL